jgi:formate-dependent nitrite reductase membrane component NrfD
MRDVGEIQGIGNGASGGRGQVMLTAILEKRRRTDDRVCSFALAFWLVSTILLLVVILIMLFHDQASAFPLTAALKGIDPSTMQWVATGCATLSSALFVYFMKARHEQAKTTFLLVMVMDGNVGEAARFLFGEHGRGSGAIDAMNDAIGGVS